MRQMLVLGVRMLVLMVLLVLLVLVEATTKVVLWLRANRQRSVLPARAIVQQRCTVPWELLGAVCLAMSCSYHRYYHPARPQHQQHQHPQHSQQHHQQHQHPQHHHQR
jgi:hypothetical protein